MRNWLLTGEAAAIRAIQRLVNLGRPTKFVLLVALDALLCIAAVWISFSLRLGEWRLWSPPMGAFGLVAIGLWLPIFLIRGIYRSIVRYIGSRTMMRIGSSCALMTVGLVAVFGVTSVEGVPRTVSVIHPLVFGLLLMLSRVTIRYILFDLLHQRNRVGPQSRVLIFGAGSAGRQLAASLRHEPTMMLHGFIDDDLRLDGQHLDGVRIYGSNRIGAWLVRLEIDTILLAIPNLPRSQRERIVRSFEGYKVRVLTLPNVLQIVDGKISLDDLRQIEIEDLLGRDPVPPNHLLLHRKVKGKSVMVTGAGGSIGSELCRQIMALNPTTIILVEMTEHALYSIEAELRHARDNGLVPETTRIVAELGNVADADVADRLFARWKPDTTFHAAAYKHVPLVEENVLAGLWNNVFSTLHCALAAERAGVQNFILISTDKAVRPTNIMGATKRICELVLQALAARGSSTRFTMVRFGNVLGSSGSVVPRFQQQIRSGGPVTLTHRDVTRYFMTIPEAAQLVIQAGAMSTGGEVFVLDMGEPVRIYDLARTMISLSGLSVRDADHPDGDIEILEVGLRPGEKLYEELLIGDQPRATPHPRIMQAREDHLPWHALEAQLTLLREAVRGGNRKNAIAILKHLVPEYAAPPAALESRPDSGRAA
ncbi:polysaccharide biosynthesis protein [Sphingomonas sp. Root241]|uniref:polysaccharide biosynthesis protein n=1 Tax=Sphingomonas sp. Root241 TaxID=1736501 RepID=UPI0006F1FAAC|nr:nucleoside-diphosphate sugar epimerase/dehydratase [Sphingomonas sp. Root241]KRC81709.1 capsule biosynthesis protein CapD [Sphingomonas sp. Root241]